MEADRKWAYLVLRLTLGINILIHGIVRLGPGYDAFIQSTLKIFEGGPLPFWSVDAFAHFIPIAEAGIGLLLVMGLWLRWALLAGAFLIMNLIFGSALMQKWEIVGIQMIYGLYYFGLLFLREYDHGSLDRVLARRRSS